MQMGYGGLEKWRWERSEDLEALSAAVYRGVFGLVPRMWKRSGCRKSPGRVFQKHYGLESILFCG